MKSHEQSPGAPGLARANRLLTASDVHAFARCILDHDLPVARSQLEAVMARGLHPEHVYLDLLAPVAQLMGHWWEEDALSFTDVTVGLGRLQQLMRETATRQENTRVTGHRILLLTAPGEQHTFGIAMVAELFAHTGWDVCGDPVDGVGDPLRRVSEEWFDVVGFTVGTADQAPIVRDLVAQVRRHSRNTRVGIMIGGAAVVTQPRCIAQIRADGVALDGRHAIDIASRLVGVSQGDLS